MKKIILMIFIVISHVQVFSKIKISENTYKKNSLALNIGGHCVFYSFSYERVLFKIKRYKMFGKIDMAYYLPNWNIAHTLWAPLTVNHMLSFHKHSIEIGHGILFAKNRKEDINVLYPIFKKYGILSLGYRHQLKEGRYFYKISFTPIIEKTTMQTFVYPMAGATLGYTF